MSLASVGTQQTCDAEILPRWKSASALLALSLRLCHHPPAAGDR